MNIYVEDQSNFVELQRYCVDFTNDFIRHLAYEARLYSVKFGFIDIANSNISYLDLEDAAFLFCLNTVYGIDESRSCMYIRSKTETKSVIFVPIDNEDNCTDEWVCFYSEYLDGKYVNTPLFSTVMDEYDECSKLVNDLYELCTVWGKKLLLSEEALFLMETFC